jgi:hypothetical protein
MIDVGCRTTPVAMTHRCAGSQDAALSRLKQGFDSPRERQWLTSHFDFLSVFGDFPKLLEEVWGFLFAL